MLFACCLHSECVIDDLFEFIVEDEHQCSSCSSQHIRPCSLEECRSPFISGNLGPAINSARVQHLVSSRLHHHSSSHGIERIRQDSCQRRDGLRNHPSSNNGRVLILSEDHRLRRIVQSKVGSTVDNNPLHRDKESLVDCKRTSTSHNLSENINKPRKLSLFTLSGDISGEAGTGEIQRVDDQERGGSRGSSRSEIGAKELPELSLRVVLGEHGLEGVLEGEVERLRREVPHDVGEIAAPHGSEALLGDDPAEAVGDPSVLGNLAAHDSGVRILGLDQKLHALNRSNDRLGNSRGNATGQPVNSNLFERSRRITHY